VLLAYQVLPKQENKNSGYEKPDQDWVQLMLSTMKSHSWDQEWFCEVLLAYKFAAHQLYTLHSIFKMLPLLLNEPKSLFCNISAKGSCPGCNAGSNGC